MATKSPSTPSPGGEQPPQPPPLDEEEAFAQRVPSDSIELPEGRSLRVHTARGVLINSVFQIGLTGLGFVRRVGVAAFLTTSEYGFWGLIVTTLITLSWLKQVGINDKYVQQDEGDQELAFQKAFTLELIYSVLTYGLIVAALPIYALIYGESDIILPGVIAAVALVIAAFQSPIWVAYRRMQFVRQRTLESIDPVVSLVVTFALGAAGYGYWSLVWGGIAGALASSVAAVAKSQYKLAFRYDAGTMREYFSFSWPLVISTLSSLVIVQGTVIVSNWSVGLAGVGIIGLAGTIALFADRIDGIVRQTIYPAICRVRDRRELFFEAFVKSNRIGVFFGLTFGIGFFLFAPDLVTRLLGDEWESASGLLQALGLIVGFRQIAYNWTDFMRADGVTRPLAISSALLFGEFLLVTAPLILIFGTWGYAAGMAVGVVVDLGTRTYFLSKLFPDFQILRHLYRSVIPSVPALAAVLAIRLVEIGPRTLGMVALELVVYFGVTAAATLKFERPLLTELIGYLKGGGRVREAT
jgi:polysaccharide transporter, PST family